MPFTSSGIEPPLRFKPGPAKSYAQEYWKACVLFRHAMNFGIETEFPMPSGNFSPIRTSRSAWL